jgi:hypothetical protein
MHPAPRDDSLEKRLKTLIPWTLIALHEDTIRRKGLGRFQYNSFFQSFFNDFYSASAAFQRNGRQSYAGTSGHQLRAEIRDCLRDIHGPCWLRLRRKNLFAT